MLIVEIVLTIIAWNRGWRWYALLPCGVVVVIGFLIGIGIGVSGGSTDNLGAAIPLEIIAILILLFMCFRKKEVKKEVISDNPDLKE